ncbi:hypothetical protein EDB81DRAFT_723866 [Dactylonectria macrodidyma]|uniref:Zonadhesin n=1 Tax=Dactylonectria macrodidyma TaxID=307937 RepID=A0A9P9IYP8_9HYPO|nr:hypothetical protein EDB81DRAFT_723866 [Dactylonectria macrodidyma]
MYSNQQGIDAATYEYDPQHQPSSPQDRSRNQGHQRVPSPEDHPWDANTPYDPPSTADRQWADTQAEPLSPQSRHGEYRPHPTRDPHWGHAEYHPQSTEEERQWDDGITKQPIPRKRPDYRPTPLRWYFLVGLIACIMAILGLVVYARQKMPKSDTDVKFTDRRWLSDLDGSQLGVRQIDNQERDIEVRRIQRRDVEEQDIQERDIEERAKGGVSVIVSTFTNIITYSASTIKFTTMVPSTIFTTEVIEPSPVVHGGSTSTTWVMVTQTSTIVSYVMNTQTGGVQESVIIGQSTSYSMIDYTGTAGTPVASSVPYTFDYTSTIALTLPGEPQSSDYTRETTIVASSPSVIVGDGTTAYASGGGTTKTQAVGTTNVESVGTTTKAATTFIEIGRVTITSAYTLPPGSKQTDPPSDKSNPNNDDDDDNDSNNNDSNNNNDSDNNDSNNNNSDDTDDDHNNNNNDSNNNDDHNNSDNNSNDDDDDNNSDHNNSDNDSHNSDNDNDNDNNNNNDNSDDDNDNSDNNDSNDNNDDNNSNNNHSSDDDDDNDDDNSNNNSHNNSNNDDDDGDDGDSQNPPEPTTRPSAKVIEVVSVEADKTINKVEKVDPVTMVSEIPGGETVIVVSRPPETIVTEVGGYTTTMDVTLWGSDGLPTVTQVTSSYSGWLETIVNSVEPTTFVSTKSGFMTTITSTGTESTTIASVKKGTTKSYSKTSTMMVTYTPTRATTSAEPEETGPIVIYTEKVYDLDEGGYFLGKFLPPFLSVMLSIPARIIDLNAQLYQPFYALNRPNGALGPDTMTLHFSGWTGFLKPFTTLADGHPVTFLSMLIVWCTALMTPVATEAIGVKLHGSCTSIDPTGCAAALGVTQAPTHVLIALLAFTIVLLCLLLYFLRNWETGLYSNPWSVAGIASLAINREIRPQKGTEKKIAKEMAEKRYGFGYFENSHGQTEYGIVLYDDAGQNLQGRDDLGTMAEVSSVDSLNVTRTKRRGNPFMALGIVWRLCFLLFLVGLMVLIIYYGATFKKQNDFQGFMTGQTFGIRFMFAVLGVIISFGWTAFFISVAMIVPYQVMSCSPQSASNSILLTRPTNPFSGIWSAFKHGQPYPAVVALMTILSEFMPILLANVPWTLTQTAMTHYVCLRMSVVIMGLMSLTLGVSFFIRWPHMPVDPRSISGAMYYVSESGMLSQFSGMASLNNEQRQQRVREIGGRYWFGEILTRAGATRPAVDRDDGTHESYRSSPEPQPMRETVDTAYHGYQG